MSDIEVVIKPEDDGGEVWLEITGGAAIEDGRFVILDSEAADLLEDILSARRPGTYQFGPLDVNG